jgi:hypothetical protein
MSSSVLPVAPQPILLAPPNRRIAAPQPIVCGKTKGCKNEGYVCAASGCVKTVCRNCYEVSVLTKNKIPLDNGLPDELAACTVKCHKKALKDSINSNQASDATEQWHQRSSWDLDTPNGEYQGSSEEALLYDSWLKVPGNFAFWKGNEEQGISKTRIQHTFAKQINDEGLRLFGPPIRTRTAIEVGGKITYIISKFLKTFNWSHQTGQGIREERNLTEAQFRDLVAAQFPHYWDLFEIMADRSSTRPVFASDDLDIPDDDDDADDDDLDIPDDNEENQEEPQEDGGPENEVEVVDLEAVVDDDDDDDNQDRGPAQLFRDDTSSIVDEEEEAHHGNPLSPVQNVYVLQPSSSRTVSSSKTTSSRKKARRSSATTGSLVSSAASLAPSIAQQQKLQQQQQRNAAAMKKGPAAMDTNTVIRYLAAKMDNNQDGNNVVEMKRVEIEANVAAEVRRHNIEMEGIEKNKFATTTVDAARSETEYSLDLVTKYNKMRVDFPHYTVKDIAKMFPQFIVCLSEEDLLPFSDEQKQRFLDRYNKWNEDRGLKSRLDFL